MPSKICWCGECEVDRGLERLAYDSKYLEGWAYQTRVMLSSYGTDKMKYIATGCITLCVKGGKGGAWDISTPSGAGMADAALSAWGL